MAAAQARREGGEILFLVVEGSVSSG